MLTGKNVYNNIIAYLNVNSFVNKYDSLKITLVLWSLEKQKLMTRIQNLNLMLQDIQILLDSIEANMEEACLFMSGIVFHAKSYVNTPHLMIWKACSVNLT